MSNDKVKVKVKAKAKSKNASSASSEPASNAPVSNELTLLVLPHTSKDANCLVNIQGRDKTYSPCQKLSLALGDTKLNKAFVEIFQPVLASKMPQGARGVIQVSPYSGGIRVGVCVGKNASSKFVVSNTGGKFTFQAQGSKLNLPKLHKFAHGLDVNVVEGGADKSYVCYALNDKEKAVKIANHALTLLTI